MDAQWTPEREVTPELALGLIGRQFPALAAPAPSIARIGVGWDNVAYLVAGRFVFRFPQRRLGVSLIETESRLLPELAPRLPLPVPVPIFVGAPSVDYPWPFHGYERIAGRSACGAALDEAARARTASPLGEFLRALHAFPVDAAARLGAPGDLLGRADVPKRVRQTRERLAEARERGLGAENRSLDRIWEEAQAGDGPPPPAALVHGDLYARHLLVGDDGALGGVIDWGDVHLGHRALDLSIAFAFLPPAARPAFFAAYGDMPDGDVLRRARLQALFSGLSLLIYGTEIGDGDLVREARVCLAHLA
jgi:aminoglycoside phosphotransferase (APT) family kinase protein